MRTWAGSSQEVLKERIYSWSKPQTDLCPRSAFYPLNPKVQKLFKGWALRSAQIVHGMSWWLTGAVRADAREECISIYRAGCCSSPCPAHPHAAVHCSTDCSSLMVHGAGDPSDHCTVQIKSASPLSHTISIKKKKSYLFILIIPESNICRKLKGKHKNPWWVAGSIFSNSLTAQLIH